MYDVRSYAFYIGATAITTDVAATIVAVAAIGCSDSLQRRLHRVFDALYRDLAAFMTAACVSQKTRDIISIRVHAPYFAGIRHPPFTCKHLPQDIRTLESS